MPLPDLSALQNPYGQTVTFKVSDVLPPSAVYVGPNDQIFLQLLMPTLTAVQVTISYRLLRASDGQLVSTVVTQQITGPAFPFRLFIPPTEGYLLALMVQSNNVSRGQIFCRVFINQGQLNAVGNLVGMLVQGYISITDVLVYPGSVFETSLNGRGWLRTIQLNNTTGTAPSIAVPANVHWLFRSLFFTYSASAAGAARNIQLRIQDNAADLLVVAQAAFTVAPNTQQGFTFAPGLNNDSVAFQQNVGMVKDLVLIPGYVLSANAFTEDPADTFTGIFLVVEEFIGQ